MASQNLLGRQFHRSYQNKFNNIYSTLNIKARSFFEKEIFFLFHKLFLNLFTFVTIKENIQLLFNCDIKSSYSEYLIFRTILLLK
jgi:hypothetical protein